jgi:hypothetical protein
MIRGVSWLIDKGLVNTRDLREGVVLCFTWVQEASQTVDKAWRRILTRVGRREEKVKSPVTFLFIYMCVCLMRSVQGLHNPFIACCLHVQGHNARSSNDGN